MDDMPGSLQGLWQLAEDLGLKSSQDPLHALEPVGLLLVRPLERWDSECTPVNSLTFAQTGGGGVHFGLLQLEGSDLASAPVVMTVPSAPENPNMVVAGDFDEFLAIGAIAGWFTLEQLAYDLDDALHRLAAPDPDPWSERDRLLELIREKLGIDPAPLTLKRFEELRLEYQGEVLLEDDEEWE